MSKGNTIAPTRHDNREVRRACGSLGRPGMQVQRWGASQGIVGSGRRSIRPCWSRLRRMQVAQERRQGRHLARGLLLHSPARQDKGEFIDLAAFHDARCSYDMWNEPVHVYARYNTLRSASMTMRCVTTTALRGYSAYIVKVS